MKIEINKFLIFISLFFFTLTYERSRDETINGKKMTFKSSFLVDEDTRIDEGSLTSNNLYDITILVVDGATLTITSGRNISKIISKSSVKTSLQEKHDNFQENDDYKYGLTSTIVAIGPNTKVIIEGATIYVDSDFSNAIMAFNGASVYIRNSIIITKSDYSKGIVATSEAYVDISSNTKIYTEGIISPCLEVNKNKGEISGSQIYLYSEGEGSSLINNLGDGSVMILDGSGKSSKSQILIIQGDNEVILHKCFFTCNGKGINKDNKNENNNINNGGIVLYKGDENYYNVVNLQLFNCNFKVENEDTLDIPMFSCYGTEADITLDGTETTFKNTFMKTYNTNSKIDTKIVLIINKTGFNGEINAEDGTKIYLKIEQNLLNNYKIEYNENVELM